MSLAHSFWLALSGALGAIVAIFYTHAYNPKQEEDINLNQTPIMPIEPPQSPETVPIVPVADQLAWDTPKHAWHAVRVLCDQAKLSLEEKNRICACIYQESQFYNYFMSGQPVIHKNPTSTDWGICQVNDHYHIGPTLDFPSVDFVMKNPDKVVQWMIGKYKAGQLKQWVSYSSGEYKQWLSTGSKMWELAQV